MVDMKRILEGVPDYQAFMTVDELDASTRRLAEEYPDVVKVFEAGVSRQGHPILCMRIGNGGLNALCFACPHPNEPIGAMSIEYFSRLLAEDQELREELGYTWYMIKCIDPDGTRLNEGWFKGPFNLYNYMRHYFRPVGTEQVEWTFPVKHKTLDFDSPLPETEVLMRLIEETQPKFMYSLHNTGFGGAYWYLSEPMPSIFEALYGATHRQQVPISMGEPESPSVIEYAPAIYHHLSAGQAYDYLEQYGGDPSAFDCGTSSADYVLSQTGDCVTLLTELPYFFDPRIENVKDSEITRVEAIRQHVEQSQREQQNLEDILRNVRRLLQEHNPFAKLVEQILLQGGQDGAAKLKWAENLPDAYRPATVSQLFTSLEVASFYYGLALGLVIRACEFELEHLSRGSLESCADEAALRALTTARQKGLEKLCELCEQLEQAMDYTVIPIQKLVRIQIECGLIVSAEVRHKHEGWSTQEYK
ncbi:M14 family zinc carboxypeptidase [Paenibacillus massiliensis]|uniref:M14 family zinc carboxypeptidase n=1 Tax=Paenibacillus massiliensis TaxID=225917 RepID=UPI000361DDBA|nr:M14 family zinc carboxypeptidase [Paenibacillus massiliensis]